MKIDENGVLYELEPRDVVDGVLIIPKGVKKIDWGNIYEGELSVHSMSGTRDYIERDINLYCEGNNTKKAVLPNTLIELCDGCFQGFKNLEEIVFSDSVTKIGDSCFYNCKNLKQIRLSRSLKSIPYNAFAGCKLDHLIVPDSVESIDEYAFSDKGESSNVGYLRIPTKMQKGDINGEYSKRRKKIGMSDIKTSYLQSSRLVIKDVDTIGEFAFSECQNLEEVIICEGVKSIERGAFAFCPKLKKIELPKSLENISSRAFWGCESLERSFYKIGFR